MMKKILGISLFLFGLATQLWAQSLADQLVDELCECVMEEVTPEADAETIKMELGLCMLNITSGRSKEIEKEMGIDLSSTDGFRKFGEQLGGVLALKCEKFVELLFQAREGENSLADEALEGRKEESSRKGTQRFMGKITELNGKDILILVVEGEAGKERFYCLEEFSGVGVIKFEKELLGKDVIIEYTTRSLFNPDTFSFQEEKILGSITLK